MSRRSHRAEVGGQADGLLRLVCPSGHTVGYLHRSDVTGPIMLLDERRGGGRSLNGAFQPIRLKCYPCFRSSGAQMDLRLSQARAEQLLQEVLEDPNHRVHQHVLGG